MLQIKDQVQDFSIALLSKLDTMYPRGLYALCKTLGLRHDTFTRV